MARLARAAIERDAMGFKQAGAEFAVAGFPLIAAHAYHLGGEIDEAQHLYAHCGATAFLAPRESIAAIATAASRLSERESAVARFAADGLSNLAIAEQLSVSKNTVENYLTSIFRKYVLRSRSQIATCLKDNELSGS
ncbi:MAG: helix-turn-helix transcriptional regulator [Candidatus Eremiobacteraeota bacterium]|nr:helix-turn-helix transcriptional regulator [Candidatus Eremiobacteraeota bacterium]